MQNELSIQRPANQAHHKGPPWLLVIGMLVGLTLALGDLLWRPTDGLQDDLVAKVDNYTISKAEFNSTVKGIESESKTTLTTKQRQALLDRMVEEYLLVDYAKAQDMLMVNPDLRRRAVDKVLQTLREQAAAMQPSREQLAEFVQVNAAYFGNLSEGEQAQDVATLEWQRRQAETLLTDLINQLRQQANVQQVDKP